MEKNFRQIEAEIREKGFSALCKEAATEIQNITRMLGYLGEIYPELDTLFITPLTSSLITSGMNLMAIGMAVEEKEG